MLQDSGTRNLFIILYDIRIKVKYHFFEEEEIKCLNLPEEMRWAFVYF